MKKNLLDQNSFKFHAKGMKFKFSSDDDLPLSKTLEFRGMMIFVTSVFIVGNKNYPQMFLDARLYKLVERAFEYDRIDDSEGIDINKTDGSHEDTILLLRLLLLEEIIIGIVLGRNLWSG